MRFVEVETQGESKTAIVSCDHITYLAESIYGTVIHLDSGEYIVCVGELREVAAKIAGGNEPERLLLQPQPEDHPSLRLR